MTPMVQTYMQQARSFLLEGNPARAIDLLKKAKAVCKDEPHMMALILKDLVAACRSAGRSEEASRYYLELKAMTPGTEGSDSSATAKPIRSQTLGPWAAALISLVVVSAGVGGVYWATRPRQASQILTPGDKPDHAAHDQRVVENTGLVVIIGTYKTDPGGLEVEIPFSSGSAFAFRKDGYMLTNRHVVDGRERIPDSIVLGKAPGVNAVLQAKRVMVCFGSTQVDRFDATVTTSERIDMAVLKINRAFPRPYKLLDGVSHLGAEVQAAGYPGEVMDFLNDVNRDPDKLDDDLNQMKKIGKFNFFDLEFQSQSFTPEVFTGHISQSRVEFPDAQTNQVAAWVQFDGVIHHGNSGGPLLDEDDNIVGMVTRFMDGSKESAGINFAISSVELRKEVAVYIQSP